MTDYLLIECIINNLVQNGIIVSPQGSWKKTVIGTQFYYADFFRAGTGSLISFRVSVFNGNHVISVTAFVNQANFFKINPSKILEECKL
jgi:predicted deacylase